MMDPPVHCGYCLHAACCSVFLATSVCTDACCGTDDKQSEVGA